MAEEVTNSSALLENSMWKGVSGGFLDFYGRISEYNVGLIATSTAWFNCIYMKWDGKGVISSLKLSVMSWKKCFFKESMMVCKKFILLENLFNFCF